MILATINDAGAGFLTWLLHVEPDGDLNLDGDVDLVDFNQFQACLDGPESGLAPGCICADLDMDDDVDLADFSLLMAALTDLFGAEGACCYPSGGCLDLVEADCAISEGVFQGPGTKCASTECPG